MFFPFLGCDEKLPKILGFHYNVICRRTTGIFPPTMTEAQNRVTISWWCVLGVGRTAWSVITSATDFFFPSPRTKETFLVDNLSQSDANFAPLSMVGHLSPNNCLVNTVSHSKEIPENYKAVNNLLFGLPLCCSGKLLRSLQSVGPLGQSAWLYRDVTSQSLCQVAAKQPKQQPGTENNNFRSSSSLSDEK